MVDVAPDHVPRSAHFGQRATEGVPHLYLKYRELSPPEALLRAFRETNTEINRRGMANTDFHNMGTSLLQQGETSHFWKIFFTVND